MKEGALQRLGCSIINLDANNAERALQDCIVAEISGLKVFATIAKSMEVVGQKYESGEYFLSEMMAAGVAVKSCIEILKKSIGNLETKNRGKVVIGTVRGDLHDLGKDLVIALLYGLGVEVYDLGVDVSPDTFVEKTMQVNANIVGLSALLVTTMPEMKIVIEALKKAGIRDKVRVIIGGRPVSKEYADEIGADAYAEDAFEGVRKVKEFLKIT